MLTTTRPDSLVCGVDDSAHAAGVVAVAAGLAERLDLRLRLVHAPAPTCTSTASCRRGAEARPRAAGRARPTRQHDRSSRRPGPSCRLLRAAIDEQTALAVVGSRGRGPGRAALLGSISRALAATSPSPVVVVPPGAGADIAAAPTIVCGVDGSAGADAALSTAPRSRARSAVACSQSTSAPTHSRRTDLADPGPPAAQRNPRRRSRGVRRRGTCAGAPRNRLPISTRVESGHAADRLAAVAARAAAILVVGSRGHGAVHAAVVDRSRRGWPRARRCRS